MLLSSEALFGRARGVMPGGVSSPVRAFGAVGGTPRFVARAEGAWITDVEGRSYVDLVGGWGPAILGHSHPGVVAAVQRAVAAGARLVQAPEQMPWGQTVAYVADINDALVELCTPMAPPPAA